MLHVEPFIKELYFKLHKLLKDSKANHKIARTMVAGREEQALLFEIFSFYFLSFFLISSLKAPQPFCDEDDDGFGNGFDDQAFYASRFVPIYGLSLLSKRLLPIKTCRVGHGKEVPFLYLPKKQGVKARPKPGPPSICTL